MSLFTKKACVGLDIGHHTLRAVQVERTTSGWRVAKSASAPTPEDTVRDGVVIDPTILGLAIKNMLKSAHISATSASIAISGGTVVVRPIRLPKMAEAALRKSIRFEASRYVPNSVEDSYIEFEIIGDVDATNMDVIIAAAPKELVDSRVAACEQAGLEVEHVEIATFAAYRSIIEADHSHEWADKTVGLVDIGAAVTNLGVISSGAFSMTRAIPAGGQVLTDALKSYFKLSTEDAESGKSQLDIRGLLNEASVAENPPLRILHTHVDDLVREVRRSINYWQSQQNEAAGAKHVDVIVLCGGGSNLPGLSEYFQHKLGIETLSLGVFDNSRFIASHPDVGRGLDMGVAVGLAMGLAPSHAVVRDSKPVEVKEAKSAKAPKPSKPPKPPKDPKPPKPAKGRTFKVTRPVEAPPVEADKIESAEGVEIAAFMPMEQIAPITPESVPLVATAMNEEPASDASQHAEFAGVSVDSTPPQDAEIAEVHEIAPATEEVEQIVAEVPHIESNIEEKYGPELAALIGAFENDTPVAMTTHATAEEVSPLTGPDELVQPRSASQRMAIRGTSPPVTSEAPDVPEQLDPPVVQETVVVPAAEVLPEEKPDEEGLPAVTAGTGILMPSAETAIDVNTADPEPYTEGPLMEVPAAELPPVQVPAEVLPVPSAESTIDVPTSDAPHVDEQAEEMAPGHAPAAQAPVLPMIAEVPEATALRSALLSDPVASTLNVPASALQADKSKKSLFSFRKKTSETAGKLPKPVKAEKPAKPAKEAKGGSPLKKAASWLFGGPNEQVKPTGKLTPRIEPARADIHATTVASRDVQIELLRGSSLEPVDTTVVDAKPEAHTQLPEPEVVADIEPPKAKVRKTPVAKKPRTTDSETDSKKEAA